MEKENGLLTWVSEGYSLYAKEGKDGIQVERLARMVGVNKSSFYHYFGDLEGYHAEILRLHERNVDMFLRELQLTTRVDPDYMLLLVKFWHVSDVPGASHSK
ncbi:MAG TPA: TetR/AcrR family transcriptional regulator [Chryseolinea sp.]|nr:TetR/AcrR family transcriptional regulator [Chryseolinea sp.]